MNHEVFDLHRIRLAQNWTFDALALRIGISRRNLFRLFRYPQATMHATTRAKIQRFIVRHGRRRRSSRKRQP
jgi:transcriptional regulator GlxA family with amidase domain